MLPFRSPSGGNRRSNLSRPFGGAPINTSSNSILGRALASPATPGVFGGPGNNNNQWALQPTRPDLPIDELKRACGLPEHIVDFILNISVDDLYYDAAEDDDQAPDAQQPSTATPFLPTTEDDDDDKEHTVSWPTQLRPRAIIVDEAERALSSSLELVRWRPKGLSLQTLPAEIRLNIFAKLLEASEGTITPIPADTPHPTNTYLSTPTPTAPSLTSSARTFTGAKSLLLTCHLFRRELLPLFAARYTYKVHTIRHLLSLFGPSPSLPHSHLPLLRPHHIQHLTLTTTALPTPHSRPGHTKAFMQLCCLSLLLLPSLRSLTITHLPRAFSPTRLRFRTTGDDDADDAAAAQLGVYRCSRLTRYGLGSRRDRDHYCAVVAQAQAAAAAAVGAAGGVGGASGVDGEEDGQAVRPGLVTSEDFLADTLGVPGWGVAFFWLGEMLQEWMWREGQGEFALFGAVYRATSGVAFAVTLMREKGGQ